MQNFLSLWLNAGAKITHGGQVQRPRQISRPFAFLGTSLCQTIRNTCKCTHIELCETPNCHLIKKSIRTISYIFHKLVVYLNKSDIQTYEEEPYRMYVKSSLNALHGHKRQAPYLLTAMWGGLNRQLRRAGSVQARLTVSANPFTTGHCFVLFPGPPKV